jgi:hypothetical protein
VPACFGLLLSAAAVAAEPDRLVQAIQALRSTVPHAAGQFGAVSPDDVAQAARAVDHAAAELGRAHLRSTPEQILSAIEHLATAKQQVDRLLDGVLDQRVEFAVIQDADSRRRAVRNYLRVTTQLIDLSGRLEYQLADAIGLAAFQFAGQPALRDELIDRLIVLRSGVGASIMSWALLDPPPNSPNRAQPTSTAGKAKLLAMISWSGRLDTLPVVARFLKSGTAPPELVISAAEAVRQLGLPQDPRPGGDSKLPPPAISAAELHRIVSGVDARRLNRDLAERRSELLSWLASRVKQGVEPDGYRLGRFEVRPGDWLLMRNSSPYNLFTELSPGLFTHVSVVALERGSDGIRRMVVVEVTERAARIPASNVESVLDVPLYWAFVRHEDAAAARSMGEVAATLIGNELEYDLGFDTARVAELRGQPLAGRKINTYCAGLPLLCAQETGLPREEFFPLVEAPAGGRMVENLSKIGIRLGDNFVSPTGSLFARRVQIIGRSEHVYAPGREIEQNIYDHFVSSFAQKTLVPTPTLFQSLRQSLAGASRSSPLLARALAAAAGVNPEMDLVAAAKTATVIETLMEVATSQSRQFLDALVAVRGDQPQALAAQGRTAQEIEQIKSLRQQHADLHQRVQQGQVSPREASDTLVAYYTAQGKREIDRRFFAAESTPPSSK